MGGTGSGRYGGRPTVEAALKLDLHHLIRQGSFRPGATVTGSLMWTDGYTGEQKVSIGYEAHMGDERGWVRLCYTTTNHWTGQQTQHDYTVELATTTQPFGGRRWWWVCPRRRDLVSRLYKPAGGTIFASRKAHRLAYRCQRQSPYDRSISQAFKRRQRLGADGGIGDPIDKPKGMRWATFDRKIDQVEAAEAVCNRGEAFASVHVNASSVMRAASIGALLGSHGAGAEILPNSLKRQSIRFHTWALSEIRSFNSGPMSFLQRLIGIAVTGLARMRRV